MLLNYLIKIHISYRIWQSNHQLAKQYLTSLTSLLQCKAAEVTFLALDLEMTGLNPQQDQIISIGLVPIVNGEIKLAERQYKLVKIAGSVGQSATIHGVLDNHLKQALPLKEAMTWLLRETKGKVLVAHHTPLDLRFIEQAISTSQKSKAKLLAIDTMDIEHQRLLRKQPMIKKGELRLAACRKRYNLPIYDAHHALIDALSCAELLLAQISKMGGVKKVSVVELLR